MDISPGKMMLIIWLFILPYEGQGQLTLDYKKQVDSIIIRAHSQFNQAFREGALEEIALAKQITLTHLGADSKTAGRVLHEEGQFHQRMGSYKKAALAYHRAVLIKSKIALDSDYAQSLNALAVIHRILGAHLSDLSEIEAFIPSGHSSTEQDNVYLYPVFSEMAKLYREMGHFDLADSFYVKAIYIATKQTSSPPLGFEIVLNDRAAMFQLLGQYDKSLEIYQQCLNLFNTAAKKNKPEYVMVLANMAEMYFETGQNKEAEVLLSKAKSRESTGWFLNKKLPYGPVLIGLTNLYRRTGEYKKAEKLYLRAFDIMVAESLESSTDYPTLLGELALVYIAMDDQEDAEYYFEQAIQEWKKRKGNRVPGYPKILTALAKIHHQKGNLGLAESLLIEANLLLKSQFGRDHPLYIFNLFELANLYWQQQSFQKADTLFALAAHLGKNRLAGAIPYMSERELHNYLNKFITTQDEILSFLYQSPATNVTLATSFENALFYKGFLLNASTRIKNLALHDPVSRNLLHQLVAYRTQIGLEYTKPENERLFLDSYLYIKDSLERELACLVGENNPLEQNLTWKDIQSRLSSDEMAIEFIHFRLKRTNWTDSLVYAALVVLPDSESPVFIPCFEEEELYSLLEGNTIQKSYMLQNLYTYDTRAIIQLGKPKRQLNELIWEKIEAVIPASTKTLWIAPSGILHRLNFGAIPLSATEILSDKYNIKVAISTRHLAEMNTTQLYLDHQTANVFGGISYDQVQVENFQKTTISKTTSNHNNEEEGGSRGGAWVYLKWTEAEANNIHSHLIDAGIPSNTYKGQEATEDIFKLQGMMDMASPRIIHVATHGFFFPDPKGEAPNHFEGLNDFEPIFKRSEQPMMRSGLILAGGNDSWQKETPVSQDQEDGILTAYEISQMNLSNTELVVLSACETGLGDIQGNEGVYGLQRAFKIAGVKYLIMSLWQVPDRETMEFMTTFYKNWLDGNMTIPDAFRKTQREMRDRFYNPYSWAGFVLVE